MKISQPKNEKKKKVGKGHLFQRVILAGTLSTRVKGAPCGCPLSQGARGFAHPEPIGVTPLNVTNHPDFESFPFFPYDGPSASPFSVLPELVLFYFPFISHL